MLHPSHPENLSPVWAPVGKDPLCTGGWRGEVTKKSQEEEWGSGLQYVLCAVVHSEEREQVLVHHLPTLECPPGGGGGEGAEGEGGVEAAILPLHQAGQGGRQGSRVGGRAYLS